MRRTHPAWFDLKYQARRPRAPAHGRGEGRRSSAIPRISILVLLALAFGCTEAYDPKYDKAVSNASENGLSPLAAALLREAKRHVSMRFVGAGLGGTVGAVAGFLGGRGQPGGTRAATTGAASGLGAALGYAFGNYIEAREARATMDEEKVSSLAAAARKDAANSKRDLANASMAIEESRVDIENLNLHRTATLSIDEEYARQAKILKAVSSSLQLFIRELQDMQKLILLDLQEVDDVNEIDHKDLKSSPLRAEKRILRDTQTRMAAQHRSLRAVADTLPQRERPEIDPTPVFAAIPEPPASYAPGE